MFPPRSNTTPPTPPTPPNSLSTPSTRTNIICRTLLACFTPRLGPSHRRQPKAPQTQTQTPARIWLFTRAAPSEKWTAPESSETKKNDDDEGMSESTLVDEEEWWWRRFLPRYGPNPSPMIDWSSTIATAGSSPSSSISSSRSSLHFSSSSSSSDSDSDIGRLYCDPSPPASPSPSPLEAPTPTEPLSPQTRSFLLANERARTQLLLSIRHPSLAEENCDETEDVEAVLRENYAAIVSFAGTADEEAKEVARRSGVLPVGWVVRDSLDL